MVRERVRLCRKGINVSSSTFPLLPNTLNTANPVTPNFLTEFAQLRLLLRVHRQMLRARLRRMVAESRLMTITLTGFLLIYSVSAFVLFRQGLEYFGRLPAAGSLLIDRMLYIIFFCFFIMLVFSVAVTGYISLYRSRDTNWLLTLPLTRRVIFLWKAFEAAVFSSWGLLFITAPLLLAFARERGSSFDFYPKTVIAIIPFVLIASSVAFILMLTVVKWLKRRQFIYLSVLAVAGLGLWGLRTVQQEKQRVDNAGLSAGVIFHQVIRHTEITVNRASPSTWVAGSVVDWTRQNAYRRSALYPALLISWSLMGMLVITWLGRLWFYDSWNQSLQNAAEAACRARGKLGASLVRPIERATRSTGVLRGFLGRPLSAITRKDIMTFRREPAQWIQFVIVFGLLTIYAMGLRQLNEHLEQPSDLYLVVTLNLAVCALALSTLTTRFVFPQFSLEGRRLWILAMSPLKLQRVVFQKFALSTLFTSSAVAVIVLISGNTLNLPLPEIALYTSAVVMLALGLNGIAVGFGVLFPNLEETNAAKIVSGFGGTFCLVLSFVFIGLFMLLLTWARIEVFRDNQLPDGWLAGFHSRLGMASAVALTTAVTGIPLFFAVKRLKRLEILGNL